MSLGAVSWTGWATLGRWLCTPAMSPKVHLGIGTQAPTWGRWFVLWMASFRIPHLGWTKYTSKHKTGGAILNSWPLRPTHFPPIRAGGGFRRDVPRRKGLLEQHCLDGAAVARNPGGEWCGANATKINEKFIERTIGGSIADTTRKLYKCHFAKWATFRRINGLSPYLNNDPSGAEIEENIILSYLSLSVGTLGKDVSTLVGHLGDIGYFHRVKTGKIPRPTCPVSC